MADDFDFRKPLQDHFSDGLAIIVGSGLSCAEGLPGMADLARHLDEELPKSIAGETLAEWQGYAELIREKGLEGALMHREPSEALDAAIATEVHRCIATPERSVVGEVVAGKRELRFSKLLPKIRKDRQGLPILTTNYDRLVELACEATGLPVDTMFDGGTLGRPDAKAVRESLVRVTALKGTRLKKDVRPHARVFKPHGSLDWYQGTNGPVRYLGDIDHPRMIVTPGRRKLRKGYDQPFDEHRNTMNRLLADAARLLIVGYGFNDDHLETRITDLIRQGLPTLILCQKLSENASRLAAEVESVIALERHSEEVTHMIYRKKSRYLQGSRAWDLGRFVDEVLTP